MKLKKLAVTAMVLLAGMNALFADHLFYFKAGGGLGYDSNVLDSTVAYRSLFGNLSLAGQYEAVSDDWKIIVTANGDSEIYDFFYYLGLGTGAGFEWTAGPGSLLRLGGRYLYLMDIKQMGSLDGEFAQDLGGFSTARIGYAFDLSGAAAGVTNEQYLGHAAWAGWNFDLGSAGFGELTVRDDVRGYSWIRVSGAEMNHNAVSASALLTFLPGALVEISAGGRAAWHDSFTTNLSVFCDTNDLAWYNTAAVFEGNAGLKVDWSSFLVTRFEFRYGWTGLAHHPVTETKLAAGMSVEWYLDDSVKLECPVSYQWKDSGLSGVSDRWKAQANIYYLF